MAEPSFTWPGVRFPNLEQASRRIVQAIYRLRDGKHEAHGTVTLRANQATTTISDVRLGGNSKVLLFPYGTANAATEFGAGTLRAATPTNGACILTHANNANSDRTFWYVIAG
jgi:hypothetical protein